jgi:hypothetical protein
MESVLLNNIPFWHLLIRICKVCVFCVCIFYFCYLFFFSLPFSDKLVQIDNVLPCFITPAATAPIKTVIEESTTPYFADYASVISTLYANKEKLVKNKTKKSKKNQKKQNKIA